MKPLDPKRMAGIIGALALALALSACSAIKLGYSNLPHLAYWWLDNYVDFSDEQEPLVRDELERLYTWHRKQELPRILELVSRVEQLAGGDVTPEQACAIFEDGRARFRALAEQAEPAAATVAASLTGREHTHLARKFRRANDKFQREWVALGRADLVDKRHKQMTDRLETFYGRLDERQQAVLRQRLEHSMFEPARSLVEWDRRQQDLLQLLRRMSQPGAPTAETRALLHAWIERLEKSPDPTHRAYQEALVKEGCTTVAVVHQSTTAAQRDQAARRLRAYERDLRDLMAPAT
jgi:hypothetical protein